MSISFHLGGIVGSSSGRATLGKGTLKPATADASRDVLRTLATFTLFMHVGIGNRATKKESMQAQRTSKDCFVSLVELR